MDRDREETIIPASGPLVLARYNDGNEYPVVAWLITRYDYDIGTEDESSFVTARGLIIMQGVPSLQEVAMDDSLDSHFIEYVYG